MQASVKLKRFLIRYYPPGIILEYEDHGALKSKPINLLQLGLLEVFQSFNLIQVPAQISKTFSPKLLLTSPCYQKNVNLCSGKL